MMDRIDKLKKIECTGCSACYNICPFQCIEMRTDSEGFLYPFINESICKNCKKCANVCPSINLIGGNTFKYPKVLAAWNLDKEVRLESTSGGIFSALATAVIEKKGCVIAVKYRSEFLVEHTIIDSVEDIPLVRQSKYIQSEKNNIYIKTKAHLEEGKEVLFVGTPCEIAGLYSFLNKEYQNLIAVDFVCLGANSPKVFLQYLKMLENRYDSKIKRIWFKNKTYGWNRFSTKVEFENGKYYLKDRDMDYFMRGYIGKDKLYIRPSCTKCKYKKIPHLSDITLADFWGIRRKNRKLDSDDGTSLVMLNSDKGVDFFKRIELLVYSIECDLADAIKGNPAIFLSAKISDRREDFFRDLDKMSFDDLIKKYSPISIGFLVKKYVKLLLNKIY